jgi:L-rhamnose-H+ transport protein
MAIILLGLLFHFIGSFSSASFYLPLSQCPAVVLGKLLVAGRPVFLVAGTLVGHFPDHSGFCFHSEAADSGTLGWTYFFGVLWGIGGLTFGLAMRYIGLSLGMSIIMGLTSALGALMPPLFNDLFGREDGLRLSQMLLSSGGQMVLLGVLGSLIGIVLCGAGMRKEREVDLETKQSAVQEFNMKKGIAVALVSGCLSACFSYGINAGKPLALAAVAHGANSLFMNNLTFAVIMLGGLTTNALWCLHLSLRRRSLGEFVNRNTPLLRNYLLCALGGLLWYLQFFFYGMGESRLHNPPAPGCCTCLSSS